MLKMRRVTVIDSHTGGEPTRVVISGGPDLGNDSLANRLERFKNNHDDFRRAVVNEPRGSDGVVGALLCAPVDQSCVTGIIFFDRAGYLGMCGHGTIGVVATLAHLNRLVPGKHRIETPVGVVVAQLDEDKTVEVANVPSYRLAANVTVEVPGFGPVRGDVAWGGNWFFLVNEHSQELEFDNIDRLLNFTLQSSRSSCARRNNRRQTAMRSITWSSLAHRNCRELTVKTSCSVPVKPTTARRAARARAPNWHVSSLMEN